MAKIRNERKFRLLDLGCEVIVEYQSRKYLLDCMDEMIENITWREENNISDDIYCDTFEILYKDGSTDYIGNDYDGHKIKRIHIESIVWNNDCTSVVFGHFEMNDCGVVHPAFEDAIDYENVREVF